MTDLSENGMYIDTKVDFPFDSNFELVLPVEDRVLKLSAVIRRVVKGETGYKGMGVELVEPPENYLKFVKELKAAS